MSVKSEHPLLWIDAYHDGELPEAHREQVEKHLARCPECRQIIFERQQLAVFLKELSPAAQLTPTSLFVADLGLKLEERQQVKPASYPVKQPQVIGWGGYILPVLLLLGLVFILTVFWVSRLVEFIPGLENILTSTYSLESLRFSSLEPLGDIYQFLGVLIPLNWNRLTGILGFAATGLIYLSWFAGLWSRLSKNKVSTKRGDFQIT